MFAKSSRRAYRIMILCGVDYVYGGPFPNREEMKLYKTSGPIMKLKNNESKFFANCGS